MIAVLLPSYQQWVPASKQLYVNLRSVPFPLPGIICICHAQTWIKDTATGLLTVVRWDD